MTSQFYAATLGLLGLSCAIADGPKKVCITQFVEHPALNETRRGIIEGLAREGYQGKDKILLVIDSAQANTALASQIAAKFVAQDPDVLVGISTLSAQTLYQAARSKNIPLIFSSVTDPLEAKLVKNLERPGHTVSGVSNFVDILPQLRLFQEIQPHLKKLGFLYNPSEANSRILLKKLKKIAPKLGIHIVEQTALKTSEIPQAASKLAGQVDAIFISNDSTALSALSAIINTATKRGIPVYVSDTDAVALGALAALGPNQYKIGLQTAKLIARILQGKAVGEIPVAFPSGTELYLNQTTSEKLGIPLSQKLLDQASKVVTKKPSSREQR